MSANSAPAETLSADKISKIRSDLDVVRNNMTVFSEILTELNPSGGGNPADLELLQELYKTCKEMQTRVGQLLATPTTDELTVDMLQINDDMNDLFDRYDRKTAAYNLKGPSATSEAPLIDLGSGDTTGGGGGGTGGGAALAKDLGAMNLQQQKGTSGGAGDADFDQFVSSRTGSGPTTTTGGGGANKKEIVPELSEEEILRGHRETDFEEMEAWLKANPGSEASLTSMPAPIESYLAHRGGGAIDKGPGASERNKFS